MDIRNVFTRNKEPLTIIQYEIQHYIKKDTIRLDINNVALFVCI